MSWYGGFAPYVPVGQRIAQGKAEAIRRLGKGKKPQPINISDKGIATTFWGKNWCTHLEKYSDFSNRLPRGRTYARNGSIADLQISKGKITSMVCGSYLYEIKIKIDPLPASKWSAICRSCSSSIHSIMDLMRGRLGDDVIRHITDPKSGLFPATNEIRLRCSCPDGAYLCKHLAATLYGVGHRLDSSPELLFLLRAVNQNELISQAMSAEGASSAMGLDETSELGDEDLGAIFGIEMADLETTPTTPVARKKATKRKAAKRKSTPKKKKATKKKANVEKNMTSKKAVKKKKSKKKVTKNASKAKASKKKAARKQLKKPSKKPKTSKKKSSTRPAKKTAKRKSKATKRVRKANKKKTDIVIRFN